MKPDATLRDLFRNTGELINHVQDTKFKLTIFYVFEAPRDTSWIVDERRFLLAYDEHDNYFYRSLSSDWIMVTGMEYFLCIELRSLVQKVNMTASTRSS